MILLRRRDRADLLGT